MKKTILLVSLLVIILGANAQKIKQTKGKLGFLKGQNELTVKFVYPDDMRVGKYSEKEYIESKMKKADDSKSSNGKKWLKMWTEDREQHYQPKFIQLFNDEMIDEKKHVSIDYNNEAKYGIIVTTTFIEPGYNIGISKKSANINLKIDFIDNESPNDVLATFTIIKSPGRTFTGGDIDTGVRIGEAYAKAAKEFAQFLVKKKAF